MKFTVLKTKEQMKSACEFFMSSDSIGLDTETTAFEPRDGDLSLIQLSDGTTTVVIDCFALLENEGYKDKSRGEQHELYLDLKELLENPKVKKTIHNSKFEHKWLKDCCGIDVYPIFDTYLAAVLLDYNAERTDPTRMHNLAAVGKRYLGVDLDKTEQQSNWGIRPLSSEQLEYAALDPYYLPKLREVMLQLLLEDNLLKVAKLEFDCAPVVAEMEMRGIKVNRDLYTIEIEKLIALRDRASRSLHGEVSTESTVQTNLFGEEVVSGVVNLSSPTQMQTALVKFGVPVFTKKQLEQFERYDKEGSIIEALPVYDRLKYMKDNYPKFDHNEFRRYKETKREKKDLVTGTGAKALKSIQGDYGVLKLLSDFRSTEKLVTSYGYNFLDHLVHITDGHERIYPNFFQIGAPTGRFACRNPNVQQIPHGSIRLGEEKFPIGFRETFDFPKGYVGINADYSQIELRIAADMSGDEVMLEAFRTGKDLHSATASKMFKVPYEYLIEGHPEYKKYKEYRDKAKACNFGIVYGAGAYTLSDTLNCTVEEAQEFLDIYKETYPVLWEFLQNNSRKAIKTLQARTLSGRLQKFNEPAKELNAYTGQMQYVRKEASAIGRNGMNMPIQGCLTGDARILVEGKGYIKIGAAEKQYENIWDGKMNVGAFVTESGKKQLTKVLFVGGNSIECSPNHKFWTYSKGSGYGWTEAKDLGRSHRVFITDNTPEFDFIDYSEFQSFDKITSYEVGTLIACYHLFGSIKEGTLRLDIPEDNYTLKAELNKVLKWAGIVYDNDEMVYLHRRQKTRYKIADQRFISDIRKLAFEDKFPEYFWQSKQLLRGFLRVVFNFTEKNEDEFLLTSKSYSLLKELQQALFLFGISASVLKGLMKSHLRLSKKPLHRFLLEVGIVEQEKAASSVNLKRLRRRNSTYYDTGYLKVSEVNLTNEFVDMYDVADSDTSQFMANGLVTHNTSADILKRALKLLSDAIKDYDAYIVNIVHDEVTIECIEADAEPVRLAMEKAMKQAAEEYVTRCPIKVDAKIVDSWGDK